VKGKNEKGKGTRKGGENSLPTRRETKGRVSFERVKELLKNRALTEEENGRTERA